MGNQSRGEETALFFGEKGKKIKVKRPNFIHNYTKKNWKKLLSASNKTQRTGDTTGNTYEGAAEALSEPTSVTSGDTTTKKITKVTRLIQCQG